jgi:hypothetical protein
MARFIVLLTMLAINAAPQLMQGAVIFQHSGAADPNSEGWAGGPVGTLMSEGPIINDNGSGFDAWFTDDNNDFSMNVQNSIAFVQTPTAGQITQGNAIGWRLAARLRVVDSTTTPNPFALFGSSVHLGYDQANRRYDLNFGVDANGEPIVKLVTGVATIPANGSSVFTGPDINVAGTGYHLYELIYVPAAGSADLFVDGIEVFSNYGGHTVGVPNAAFPRVIFGAADSRATGQGNWNLVQWGIVPEASCAALVTTALVLIRGASRTRRRRL